MKTILLTLYVLVILFLSATVRANTDHVLSPDTVNISKKFLLTIEGHLPDPCHFDPKLSVESIDLENQVVTFRLSALDKDGMCIQTVGHKLVAAVDLLSLPVPSQKEFTIKFEGDVETTAKFKLPPRLVTTPDLTTLKLNFFKGTLEKSKDQDIVLRQGSETFLILSNQSTNESFMNRSVIVWGHKEEPCKGKFDQLLPITVTAVLKN